MELSADTLAGFDFDQRGLRYPHNPYTPRLSSWPLSIEHDPLRGAAQRVSNMKRSTTPLQSQAHSYEQATDRASEAFEWASLPQSSAASLNAYTLDTTFAPYTDYILQTSPTEYVPIQSQLDVMDTSYIPVTNPMHGVPYQPQWDVGKDFNLGFTPNDFPDLGPSLHSINSPTYPHVQGHSPAYTHLQGNSPTLTNLEVQSCPSETEWSYVQRQSPNLSNQEPQYGLISNPGRTLQNDRTLSDSSNNSDFDHSWTMCADGISSPGSDFDWIPEHASHQHTFNQQHEDLIERPIPPPIVTTTLQRPIDIARPPSPQLSPVSTKSSQPGRRQTRKSPNPRAAKNIIQKPSQAPKDETIKKVGKRKGPLRPEARKAACEIRKLGACLRCRFLKKTCDKGEPCGGCKPSHARLWQVPCTRIDIKDIAYFLKDWTADYKRHNTLGNSIGNIKGFADAERTLFITHGYGQCLPVRAREVFVRDERCFDLDWVESIHAVPESYIVNTAKLTLGMDGISTHLLHDYLDRHINEGFEDFVDEYFEGTPFLTEMLKTAYRYLQREKTPVIRKCLKLLLAYNLTQHVTMVKGIGDEEGFEGKITDESSKFCGETVAPVMINFQIKCALADMWRSLQKEILQELSSLYSSVYTKDKLKHWPTIFMVATIMLGVWEEMQFDCNYRIPVSSKLAHMSTPTKAIQDIAAVNKFCYDMESKPVGVIVGLFAAISQKLPALSEWDSHKHGKVFDHNPAVCEALEEVREHVNQYGGFAPEIQIHRPNILLRTLPKAARLCCSVRPG